MVNAPAGYLVQPGDSGRRCAGAAWPGRLRARAEGLPADPPGPVPGWPNLPDWPKLERLRRPEFLVLRPEQRQEHPGDAHQQQGQHQQAIAVEAGLARRVQHQAGHRSEPEGLGQRGRRRNRLRHPRLGERRASVLHPRRCQRCHRRPGPPGDHHKGGRWIAAVLLRPVQVHLGAVADQEPVRGRLRPGRGARQGAGRRRAVAGVLDARHGH